MDASIWQPRAFVCGCCDFVCFCVSCVIRLVTLHAHVSLLGFVCLCGVVSVQGRMVDALASRADEGRGNLR